MGLKESGLRGSLRNVSVGIGAIPDAEGLHEWLMDEGEGTTAADRVGAGDLSLSDVEWGTGTGVGDTYLDFDGSGDNMAKAEQSDLSDWGDGGTMIVQFEANDTGEEAVIWNHQSNDDRFYCWLRFDENSIQFGLANDFIETNIEAAALDFDGWNGIAVVWDEGDWNAYLYHFDDEEIVESDSGTYSGSVGLNTDLTFGTDESGRTDFTGGIDFPRLLDDPKTESGVKDRFDELVLFYT